MNLPLLFVLSSKSLAPEKGSSWIFPIENVNQRSEGGLRRMSGVTVRRVNVRRFGRLRYSICRAMETALVGPGRRVDVGFVPAGLTRYVAVITGRVCPPHHASFGDKSEESLEGGRRAELSGPACMHINIQTTTMIIMTHGDGGLRLGA